MAKNGKGIGTIEVGRTTAPQIGSFGIATDEPWSCEFTIKGSASMLFHRWAVDAGDGPEGRKGSKKTDDVESYVYRCEDGSMGLPGEYVRQAMKHAAKWRKDPRSPRASAMGLFNSGTLCETELASLGVNEWDYLDRRRAVVQRSGITRVRPAFLPGWEAEFRFTVLLPEYITPHLFMDVLVDAGRLVGVADNRPQFGRFAVTRFDVL